MNKRIHVALITTAFLCNIHTHSQDTTTESTIDSVFQGIFNQSFNKRASFIDPKTGMQTHSEISHSSQTATEEPKDADYIELTRQKLGFDPKPLLSAAVAFGFGLASGYCIYQNQKTPSACLGIGAAVFSFITYLGIQNNSKQSCGQAWMHRPVNKALIILAKQGDGQWVAQYQKSQSTPWADIHLNMNNPKPLKVDKGQIEELAKEIIANHDASVKQEDLYSSQIFKSLAAQQDQL